MQIYSPKNIFTDLLSEQLSNNLQIEKIITPSSLISNKLSEVKTELFILPVLDVIKHEDVFISSKIGISFQGNLCNSYFHFNNKENLKNILLKGDVSTTDVLLGKIVLKELYNSEIEVELNSGNENESNILLSGNENFNNIKFSNSLSLSETIDELISLSFVNYVIAGYDKSKIEKINSLSENLNINIYEMSKSFFEKQGFNNEVVEILDLEIPSVTFELFEDDKEAINQLIRLPYYYGFFEDIFEIKFV